MAQDQSNELRDQIRRDRKLIERAAQVLGEIDRGPTGLSDEHADVLAALRIRLEGKERAKLEDLLSAAGDIGGKDKKDLGDVLSKEPSKAGDWPEVEDKPKDWPSL